MDFDDQFDLTFTVDVGFTTVRPIIVDQHTHRVIVKADTDAHAICAAHAMVAGHKDVTMVTRLDIVDVIA